jgi:succinoglycan biosynthesis transport protein ExoP
MRTNKSDPFRGDALSGGATSTRESFPADRLGYWARRYWWVVAVTIMIGLAIADVFCLYSTPDYVSNARMMVSGRIALPQGELYNDAIQLQNFFGTQVALMKSPQILNQAVDRITTLHPDIAVDKDAEVDAGVELRTSIFDLKVTSTNADYAKVLLDSVMDTYLASKREWKNQTTDEAVSAITEEISHLDAEIRTDEQQLLDFQKTNNVVFIETQSSFAANYLVGLNSDLARLTKEHDLLQLEGNDPITSAAEKDQIATAGAQGASADPAMQAALANKVGGGGGDPVLTEESYLEKLKILRNQLGQYLKDAHPKMKDLDESIEREQKLLDVLKARGQTTRETYREDLELQIKNLQAQIVTWNDKSLELSQRYSTYQDLRSKINREQALYNQLASSIQNVDLNKSLDQEDVVIMEAASPARAVSHNYFLRLLYGVAGGLVVGLIVAFCLIRLDNKINSPLDLQEGVDVPLLGEIPLVKLDPKSKRVPLLAEDDQRFEFLEHHRDLRSSLLYAHADEGRPRSLLITSAAPSEGKSTLAANLATTFAFSGFRVLLIDADLRKGVLHTIFEQPYSPGLSDYLLGNVPWREVIQTTRIPNLDLLPRGKVPARAGDLLLSATADQLLIDSIESYDLVIWDTAPLFAAHDASNICCKVDGVLFLARVRKSSVSLVRDALDDLLRKNARVFGVVLNAVKAGQHGHYHKYRYREYGAVTAEV